jgi:hypothetical protein
MWRTAPGVLFLGLWLVAGAGPASALPPTIEEPQTLDEFFRVDPVSGKLTPLEVIKSKTEGGLSSWYTYIKGDVSPVAFPYGEPLAIASRSLSPPADQPKVSYYKFEALAVKDGKRYASKVYFEVEVKPYGQPLQGLDKNKKKDRPAYAYLYMPRKLLPPGEYALTPFGLTSDGGHFGTMTLTGGAFRIVEVPRTPTPTAAPTPAPTAPSATTAAAPALSAADIEKLRRDADGGDTLSQLRLAQAYALGTGVPQSYEQTASWLRKAADSGSPEGQFWLAVMYRDSLVAPDPAQMVQLFRKAAEQNYAQAQANLGNLYFTGTGVVQDYVEAHKWLNLACSQMQGEERKPVIELRDKVAGLMTPDQVRDAQKRAVDWTEAFAQRKLR